MLRLSPVAALALLSLAAACPPPAPGDDDDDGGEGEGEGDAGEGEGEAGEGEGEGDDCPLGATVPAPDAVDVSVHGLVRVTFADDAERDASTVAFDQDVPVAQFDDGAADIVLVPSAPLEPEARHDVVVTRPCGVRTLSFTTELPAGAAVFPVEGRVDLDVAANVLPAAFGLFAVDSFAFSSASLLLAADDGSGAAASTCAATQTLAATAPAPGVGLLATTESGELGPSFEIDDVQIALVQRRSGAAYTAVFRFDGRHLAHLLDPSCFDGSTDAVFPECAATGPGCQIATGAPCEPCRDGVATCFTVAVVDEPVEPGYALAPRSLAEVCADATCYEGHPGRAALCP